MRKKALITGITGQDGSFLAELLIQKGYEVHGIIRRTSYTNTKRIDHIFDSLNLTYGDLTDTMCLENVIRDVTPDEVYHLAAQSHVKVSFDIPEYTGQVDALGTLRVLEAIKRFSPHSKFYNACTSEMFGGRIEEVPQKETTPFYPRSPYGVAKLYSYWISRNYRESYNMFNCNGILFNHESERRGETFVTRKVSIGLSKLANNYQLVQNKKQVIPALQLGNMYAQRDWGYAPEYVEGMWRMLQHDKPGDYVLATGETHTIKEFINEAILHTPFKDKVQWIGKEVDERLVYDNSIDLIKINPKYYRPSEVDLLVGDPYKAKTELGWINGTSFKGLVQKMMEYDMEKVNR